MKVEVLSVGGSLLFDGCSVNYSYIKKYWESNLFSKQSKYILFTEFWNNTKDVWTYLNEVETLPSGSIKNNSTLKKIYKERIDISTDMNIGKQKDLTYQYKLRQKKDE